MSQTTQSNDEKKAHLHKLLKGFRTAMLVTRADDGNLRGRPLALAEAQDDGAVYFSTSIQSPKVEEVHADPHVAVIFEDTKHYVSLSGTAETSQDRALIARLWSDAWKVWFPKGKDDPSLAIIKVEPERAEYWDQGGIAGIEYLFKEVKAFATGTKPSEGADDRFNAKVRL
jgi:general stress protein 26